MHMPDGRGVPRAWPLTPAGGVVLSVADLNCVGSFDDTVRERPVTECCPHMLHMVRRLGILVLRSRLPEIGRAHV